MQQDIIKKIYFYAVVGVSLLVLCVSLILLVRANLMYFVFPDMDSYYGSTPTSPCVWDYDMPNYRPDPNQSEPRKLSAEEVQECKNLLATEREKSRNYLYRMSLIDSILPLLVSGTVLFLHIKYVRPRPNSAAVTKDAAAASKVADQNSSQV